MFYLFVSYPLSVFFVHSSRKLYLLIRSIQSLKKLFSFCTKLSFILPLKNCTPGRNEKKKFPHLFKTHIKLNNIQNYSLKNNHSARAHLDKQNKNTLGKFKGAMSINVRKEYKWFMWQTFQEFSIEKCCLRMENDTAFKNV